MGLDVTSSSINEVPFFIVGTDGQSANSSATSVDWSVAPISEELYVVASSKGPFHEKKPLLVAQCDAKMILKFFSSLLDFGFTGVAVLKIFGTYKEVYFEDGHFIFARSSQIDDRLGEVLYQKALLSLDQLVLSAAQVTNNKRFGQVLLEGGIFSQGQLWEALLEQVKTIIKSIFLYETVELKVYSDVKSQVRISFEEEDKVLLEGFYFQGLLHQLFSARLSPDEMILLTDDGREFLLKNHQTDSFQSDFLRLIGDGVSLGQLLDTSKLLPENTKLFLMHFFKLGFCALTRLKSQPTGEFFNGLAEGLYKNYEALRQKTFTFCLGKGISFPSGGVSDIAKRAKGLPFPLVLKENGQLSEACVEDMLTVCSTSDRLFTVLSVTLRSMGIFLENYVRDQSY